jgi:hypothetical protein
MAKNRTPKLGATPRDEKRPKTGVETSFHDMHPCWRFHKVDWEHPFVKGEVTGERLREWFDRLCEFEKMTWNEILVVAKKQNHNVNVEDLDKAARDRLEKVFGVVDFDEMLSLRVGGKERIWGLLDRGAVTLVWWDTDHAVCPSAKKNT